MTLDYEILAFGWPGTAGSFGFESNKVDVPLGSAERVLLTKVRAASPSTLILANGFSLSRADRAGNGPEDA